MRALWLGIAALGLLALAGCHSAFINATISNRSNVPVTLVEVDYPSASFGVQRLAPGENYQYRFKIIGTGQAKLLWSEPSKPDQKSTGPELHESDEGTLAITFRPNAPPAWDIHLKNGSTR
jgi:hypothetical protein